MSIESYVNITTRPWSCFREKHSHRKISAEESTTDATLRKFFRFVTQSTAQINTAHDVLPQNGFELVVKRSGLVVFRQDGSLFPQKRFLHCRL